MNIAIASKLDEPEISSQEFIDNWLYDYTQGIVQSGPFTGMHILRNKAWDTGAICPQLLGTHEQELHADLEKEIARLSMLPNPKIVNIGCAEGYYAVGFARRLFLLATVFAVDISEAAIVLAKKNAADNGVDVIFSAPMEDVFAAPDLIVSDCEGSEVEYLDLEKFPDLALATMIVEVHQLEGQDTRKILVDRFEQTHDINIIFEGGRNPNEFNCLLPAPSTVRWYCVSENRPCCMFYLVLRPKKS